MQCLSCLWKQNCVQHLSERNLPHLTVCKGTGFLLGWRIFGIILGSKFQEEQGVSEFDDENIPEGCTGEPAAVCSVPDPLSMGPQKALETIGANLQKQYENWQPRVSVGCSWGCSWGCPAWALSALGLGPLLHPAWAFLLKGFQGYLCLGASMADIRVQLRQENFLFVFYLVAHWQFSNLSSPRI